MLEIQFLIDQSKFYIHSSSFSHSKTIFDQNSHQSPPLRKLDLSFGRMVSSYKKLKLEEKLVLGAENFREFIFNMYVYGKNNENPNLRL